MDITTATFTKIKRRTVKAYAWFWDSGTTQELAEESPFCCRLIRRQAPPMASWIDENFQLHTAEGVGIPEFVFVKPPPGVKVEMSSLGSYSIGSSKFR